MVALSALLTWAETWFAHDLAYMLLAEMRIDAYNTIEPLAPAYLVRRRSGDLVSIAGGDVETIELFFAHTITPGICSGLGPRFSVDDPGVAVLASCPGPVSVPLSRLARAPSSRRSSPSVWAQASDMNGICARAHGGQYSGTQGDRRLWPGERSDQAITTNGWKLADIRGRLLSHQSFQAGFIEAMTGLAGLAVMTTGAVIISQEGLPRWYLPLITVLSLAAFGPVTELAKAAKQLVETLASARRLFAIQDEPVPVLDGPGVPGALNVGPPRIDMEAVSFRYGEAEPQALADVNIHVRTGSNRGAGGIFRGLERRPAPTCSCASGIPSTAAFGWMAIHLRTLSWTISEAELRSSHRTPTCSIRRCWRICVLAIPRRRTRKSLRRLVRRTLTILSTHCPTDTTPALVSAVCSSQADNVSASRSLAQF